MIIQQEDFQILSNSAKNSLGFSEFNTHSDLINIDKADWVMSSVAHFDTDGW